MSPFVADQLTTQKIALLDATYRRIAAKHAQKKKEKKEDEEKRRALIGFKALLEAQPKVEHVQRVN